MPCLQVLMLMIVMIGILIKVDDELEEEEWQKGKIK